MTDGQLLMPSVRLARKMGISRRTLKKRIDSKEIKAVKIGPRMFIPQNEIDRLMGISPGQTSAPKPETANSVSGDSTKAGETEQNGADLTAKSPKERLDEILEGYADFLQRSEDSMGLRVVVDSRIATNPSQRSLATWRNPIAIRTLPKTVDHGLA
jgi:excisionase family DNA binding protein